jgi:hypothetical protein
MKKRIGFVSNSSSSSFMISARNPNSALLYDRFTLQDLGVDFVIDSKEELDRYYAENEENIEILKKALKDGRNIRNMERDVIHNYVVAVKELESGKCICMGSCASDSNNVVQRGLVGGGWDKLEFKPEHEIVVIRDCEGY